MDKSKQITRAITKAQVQGRKDQKNLNLKPKQEKTQLQMPIEKNLKFKRLYSSIFCYLVL